MKRKLTNEERTLTEKGIRSMHKELSGYEEELKMITASIKFIEEDRKYNDLVRPFNRRIQDKKQLANLNAIKAKVEEVTNSIKHDQESLTNGVDVKESIG